MSAALATAVVAGPATPLAAAQVTSGDLSAAVAAESPANRAIEVREGGLPLQYGSQGELVLRVQRALHIQDDGIFGVQTDAAVRHYQQEKGLDVDGIVGLATWGAMFPGQTHGAASGAAIGGSNIPAAAQSKVEQTVQIAGTQLAAQGTTGYSPSTSVGISGTTGTGTPTTTPGATTPVAGPAPGTTTVSGCGSSTIIRPVSGPVTSPFGPRGGRNHDGMDIGAATGTPVRAAACGTVSLAGQQSGYGNIVCITHTSQFSTCYAHLSRFGTTSGAHVQQGQVIGYVGCTGNCTGPHLHFETRVGGVARNPTEYLGGASMPGASATSTKASATSASATSANSSSQTSFGIGGGTSSTKQSQDTTASEIAAEVAPPGTVDPTPVPAEAAPAGTVPAEQAPATAPATTAPADGTGTDTTVAATVPITPADTTEVPAAPATTAPAPTTEVPAAPATTAPAPTTEVPAAPAPAPTAVPAPPATDTSAAASASTASVGDGSDTGSAETGAGVTGEVAESSGGASAEVAQ